MTTAALKAETGGQKEWRFESDETFSDDLGALGCWVGPRTGPYKRGQGDMEEWVLRRYLVAAKKAARLEFPFVIRTAAQDKSFPDFVMDCGGELTGFEVTEAGGETDIPPNDSDAAVEYVRAYERKLEKLNNGYYSAAAHCELLIYDNTASGPFFNKGQITEKARKIILQRQYAYDKKFAAVHVIGGGSVDIGVLGNSVQQISICGEYEVDFAGWIQGQVQKLAANDTGGLDIKNLVEELESLGRSEFKKVRSQARRLLLHLLKWEFQPERRSRGWRLTIDDARLEICEEISDSPSFEKKLREEWRKTYAEARHKAGIETGLGLSALPENCPYAYEQAVEDGDFFPGPPPEKGGA